MPDGASGYSSEVAGRHGTGPGAPAQDLVNTIPGLLPQHEGD
jgi:hypothetical protein